MVATTMDEIIALIAALGMLGWIAKAIVKVVMDADVRKIEARRTVSAEQSSVSSTEIEQLKAEILRLRDTSTEHALSLQHTVERLDRRVDFLEQRDAEATSPPPPLLQKGEIGRRELDISPAPMASTGVAQVRRSSEG